MVGSYVMTQHDCEGATTIADSIGLGCYGMDSHYVTLFVDANGVLNTEGGFFSGVDPYPISYRSIVPQPDECTNLLVPVCFSATHVAYGSMRMEPVYMIVGQAAGTAAALAVDNGTTVQGVDYRRLARRLTADGQLLRWPIASAMTASDMDYSRPTLPENIAVPSTYIP